MAKVEFTNICTAYTEEISLRQDFESFEKEDAHKTYGVGIHTNKMLCLMLMTYPKNVPEPKDYTVEDMVTLSNDPVLLAKYGTPFCVMSLFHNDRPTLYVTPHALVDTTYYMEQPSALENPVMVLRKSNDELPIVVDIRDVIEKCSIPEKFVYGCYKCLSLNKRLSNTCVIRKVIGADNPSYGAREEEVETQTNVDTYYNQLPRFHDERVIKSWGKYKSPFDSQKTKIANHLYVSPTMFYTSSHSERLHHRSKTEAFIGLRNITADHIDLDSYERHLERKQEDIDTRKKHTDNAKKHCTVCSVKETCHITFRHKKKYCSSPYPPNEEIDKYFLNDNPVKISKDTLLDIMLASGPCSVTNSATGRKCDAYISIHNDMYGLGFRVISRTKGKILTAGTTDKEWIDFKVENNISTEDRKYKKDELQEKIKDTTWYAKLLACAAIKQSPTRVSMFHSTAYAKAFVETTYNGFSMNFLWTSKRRLCPWLYEVKDWEDLFGHYGRIPGFR